VDSIDERGRRAGEIAHLLEPDVKEARGGLMDVTTLRALSASWLTDRPRGDVDAAHGALLDVRDAIHVVTGRPGNKLLLADQDTVAAVVGDGDADELLARIAEAGRTIAHAVDTTLRRARQALPRRRTGGLRQRRPQLKPLGHGMVEHDGEIVLGSTGAAADDAVLALRAAATAVRTGLPLSPVTLGNLADSPAVLPDPWPAAAREALLQTLAGGQALIPVWDSFDLAGLVTRWIPEWAGIRNRPQRNAVHRWTVDRHCIQTAAQAQPHLRDVPRPDVLMLACLLHDIGKVPGSADHSRVGAPIAERVALRIGFAPEDAAIVRRLVEEHLTLIELATRRDPDDAQTVAALVAAVDERPETLAMLRILTEADALAAGPAAWSPWRMRLVDDLVARARAAMSGAEPPAPAPLGGHETSAVISSQSPRDVTVMAGTIDSMHVLTVVAPDRIGLFSDIAGLLAAHRLGVRSALVRTLGTGAVDTWWVESTSGDEPDVEMLRRDLERLGSGDRRLLDRLAARDAAHRPARGVPLQPRVVIVPGASSQATVIEVRAADRPGLLFALGAAVAAQGADIRSAHIATLAGQAVDVLYLEEPDGGPLSPPRVAGLISALVEAAGTQDQGAGGVDAA
jgi:[protein-PII] uridylyltransferase